MSINSILVLAFVNNIASRASRVLLTLYALHLGAAPLTIGLLAATIGFFPMLLSWWSGRLSDRFGARWLMTFGAVGSAIGMMLPYFSPGLPAIFMAAALAGLSITVYQVSMQNLVGLLSAPQERARNFSNYSLAGATSGFVGPMLAGFSIDHSGYGSACLYLAALPLIPVVLLLLQGAGLPRGNPEHTAGGGLLGTLREPGVWRILAVSGLAQSGMDLFQFYMPVYGHAAGLSASAIGVVLAMYAVASFAVRVVTPRLVEKFGEEKLLAGAFVLSAAGFLLVPFFESMVALGLISFVFGLGMGLGTPITLMLMFNNSPSGRSGEAMGLRMSVDNLVRIVSPIVFGAVASGFGLAAVFWINALMLGAGGALPAALRKRTDAR
jgi:predicted MFS family arabinose efflux permease